jgi:phosphomannomutase
MNKFIFDVDGTLTPSRQKIDLLFREWFFDFCVSNDVYLVTGSDYEKTLEQLGKDICENVQFVYSCSGNEIWRKGNCIFANSWLLPQEVEDWLTNKLKNSGFPLRSGKHIEHRKGCINFSIVGRNATMSERTSYIEWDNEHKERYNIAVEFNHTFRNVEARIGGETGLDIYPKGCDKSQILKNFNLDDRLYFFGDRCEPGGNDYPLAKLIKNSYYVKDWRDTWERLENFKDAGIIK